MKLFQNAKFRISNLLLVFVFTIAFFNQNTQLTTNNPCVRSKQENKIVVSTYLKSKCNTCHTNVIPTIGIANLNEWKY